MNLSFDELREANVERCETAYHFINEWSPTDWACAMAGECGETCNLIKKWRRGDDIPLEDIADELADMVTYADLLAVRMGINLGNAVRLKFNKTSERIGSSILIK